MSQHNTPLNAELQPLLADLLDDKLTAEGQQKLCEILRGSPSAQDEYRHFMALHALLHLDFSQGQLQLLPPIVATPQAVENADRSLTNVPSDVASPASSALRPLKTRASQFARDWLHIREKRDGRRLLGALALLAASLLFIIWQLSPP